jgi:hypothetical protein
MDKALYQIFVPTQRNNPVGKNKFYSTRFHRVWDQKVRTITGGLTIHTPTKGQWVAPDGKLFQERMIPVQIVCTDDEIIQIADMTAQYYEQEAIMYFMVTSKVVIRQYPLRGGGRMRSLMQIEKTL